MKNAFLILITFVFFMTSVPGITFIVNAATPYINETFDSGTVGNGVFTTSSVSTGTCTTDGWSFAGNNYTTSRPTYQLKVAGQSDKVANIDMSSTLAYTYEVLRYAHVANSSDFNSKVYFSCDVQPVINTATNANGLIRLFIGSLDDTTNTGSQIGFLIQSNLIQIGTNSFSTTTTLNTQGDTFTSTSLNWLRFSMVVDNSVSPKTVTYTVKNLTNGKTYADNVAFDKAYAGAINIPMLSVSYRNKVVGTQYMRIDNLTYAPYDLVFPKGYPLQENYIKINDGNDVQITNGNIATDKDKISVQSNINNTTNDNITTNFIASSYDKNNKLIDIKIDFTNDFSGKTDHLFSISNLSIKNAGYIKIFCLNTSNLKPYYNSKTININNELAKNVKVSCAFGNNMVLQRDRPISIWGTAIGENGKSISVEIGSQKVYAIVNNDEWVAVLPQMGATNEQKTLVVKGLTDVITFNNVLIGDVYFIDGQSNAELKFSVVDTYNNDIINVTENDNIRMFYQDRSKVYHTETGVTGWVPTYTSQLTTPLKEPLSIFSWERVNSQNAGKMSAIGYYFAKKIVDSLTEKVPIGIIQTCSSSAYLATLSPVSVNQKYNITTTDIRDAAYIYNMFLAPFERYTAKGMVWYQGESDCGWWRSTYSDRFYDFINYLNNKNQNNLEIFFVQLSSVGGNPTDNTYSWPAAQMRAVQETMIRPNANMVVSIDKGVTENMTDKAHPPFKKPIGERLASLALYKLYGIGNLEYVASPAVISVVYDAFGATVTFSNVGDGLKTVDGGAVSGFELIKDGAAITNVNATIFGKNQVHITGVDSPTGVRYAFYSGASTRLCNLQSSSNLPVPTFARGPQADSIAPTSPGLLDQ